MSHELVQQDLFEWLSSIRDKIRKGSKPPKVYSPYKTRHSVTYGEDESGAFAIIDFKFPEGVNTLLDNGFFGVMEGFRIDMTTPSPSEILSEEWTMENV